MAAKEWNPTEILAFMTLFGFSRKQMADMLDISNVSTISRLINGQTRPTAKRIVQLNAAMGAANILRQQARFERQVRKNEEPRLGSEKAVYWFEPD